MADKDNGKQELQCGDTSSSNYCTNHGYQDTVKKDQKKKWGKVHITLEHQLTLVGIGIGRTPV